MYTLPFTHFELTQTLSQSPGRNNRRMEKHPAAASDGRLPRSIIAPPTPPIAGDRPERDISMCVPMFYNNRVKTEGRQTFIKVFFLSFSIACSKIPFRISQVSPEAETFREFPQGIARRLPFGCLFPLPLSAARLSFFQASKSVLVSNETGGKYGAKCRLRWGAGSTQQRRLLTSEPAHPGLSGELVVT